MHVRTVCTGCYAPAPNTVETRHNEPLYNKLISIIKGGYKDKNLDYNGKHILPVPWAIILSHFSVCGNKNRKIPKISPCKCKPPQIIKNPPLNRPSENKPPQGACTWNLSSNTK